jgi:DNA-binding response OmpR family regulator
MPKRIMIIEDNEDILNLICIALEEKGYFIIAGRDSGPLRQIAVHRPDLILMDNALHDASGNSLCLKLKSDPATSHLPVVLVSAHADLTEVASACHADAYLSKPFNIADLLAVVKRFL